MSDLDDRIVQIIGFATGKAFEAGMKYEQGTSTWSNSPLIQEYGWQIQDLITNAHKESDIQAKKLVLNVLTDIDSSPIHEKALQQWLRTYALVNFTELEAGDSTVGKVR